MSDIRQRPGDQPLPASNDQPCIQTLVRTDLHTREQLGRQRYGTVLQPHNGRDALRDLYEELLDAACYARQAIEERHNPAFLVIQTMQERLDRKTAEVQRLEDLVTELRKQLVGALRHGHGTNPRRQPGPDLGDDPDGDLDGADYPPFPAGWKP